MSDPVPTLYEWAGGQAAIDRLMLRLYEKVPQDPLLQPAFAGMTPDHSSHVAAFVAEVLGGPPSYSAEGAATPA